MNALCSRSLTMILLFVSLLAGCDIAPTERINQDEILGEPNPGNLDPELDANLTAFFYAGKPVYGLLYSCSRNNFVEFSGSTDENGMFICPRDTRANFYVGVARSGTIKIGQVDLNIFGSEASLTRRNNVVVTPGTLYGTHVDGGRREIVNIFNLLYSLDAVRMDGRRQSILEMRADIMNAIVVREEFTELLADGGVRDVSTSRFNANLAALIDTLAELRGQLTLEQAAAGSAPLGETEARNIANIALRESRAGLYRTPASGFVDALPSQIFYAKADMFVGRSGSIAGVAYSEERVPGGSTFKPPLAIEGVATMDQLGILDGVVFGTGSDALTVLGAIINNSIWGASRLCNVDSANEHIPEFYCVNESSAGGFSVGDAGRFSNPRGFEGEAVFLQPISGLPDIDLDNLPANFNFPVTYEMTFSKYPDIEAADYYNLDYDEVGDDKAAFGSPLIVLDDAPAQKLRYTLMGNGDIVSDGDRDCADLTLAGGVYRDADGDEEYVIGRIGSIFTRRITTGSGAAAVTDTDTFLDVYINVLAPAHSHFGLTLGIDSMFRSGLHEMLLQLSPADARNHQIRSKSCDPTSTTVCNHKVEWFNNVRFWNEVYRVDQSTPTAVTAADQVNYRDVPFYGQVHANELARTAGAATGICAAALP
jgi:hypothetical protein